MQSAAVDRANEQAEQSTRALAQLQSQAVDERRHAAAREAAAAAAAAAHRRAVNEAVGRLNAATEEVRNGLSQVVEMETASVSRLQQHEAFRARTARMLVLNAHRGVMARCYRAWRRHTAQIVGSKMLDDGATAAMAELRNRSLALALVLSSAHAAQDLQDWGEDFSPVLVSCTGCQVSLLNCVVSSRTKTTTETFVYMTLYMYMSRDTKLDP